MAGTRANRAGGKARAMAFGAFAGLTLLAPLAAGQPSAGAVAQVLFEEGVALMEQQRYEEACPKLAESQRIDPGGGTLLNLAACLEQLGKLASAYSTYNEALGAAVRDGRKDREATSREKLASLRPRMRHVRVFAPATPGLEVHLDDTALGEAAWGVPLPIDPGRHTVRATAPGHAPWESSIDLRSDGRDGLGVARDVRIPPLVPDARKVAAREGDPSRRSAALGFGLGGAGLLALGGVAGAVAFAQKSSSDDACPTATTCTPDGAAAMDRAVGFAWASTAAIGLGLVALGVGGYFAWSSSARAVSRASVRLTPLGSVVW